MHTHSTIRLFVFCLVCFSAPLFGSVAHADDAQAKEMKYAYSEGYNLYQRGSYKNAIAYFSQAYRLAPQNDRHLRFRAAVAFFLAVCYDKLQQPRVARRWLQLYRKSKAADPRFRQEADTLWERIRPRTLIKPPTRREATTRPRPTPPDPREIGEERLYDLPSGHPIDRSPSTEELQRRLNDPNHYKHKTAHATPPMQIAAYVLLGIGAAALLAGASTHIAAAYQDAQARELFAKGPQASVPSADITSRLQSADSLQTTSLVIYGAAALFAATGTLLFFLSKPTTNNPQTPTSSPSTTPPPSQTPPTQGRLLTYPL